MKLSSKAKTLQDLKEVITNASVLPLIRFKAIDYLENKDAIVQQCLDSFISKLIIRSSSANEDNLNTSNAGGFDSVLNVKLNKTDIDKAILRVIQSYETVSQADEVFIQPMLENVSMSGVVFTADLDTLASYYIVNYDESGSTTSVTSGDSNKLKTFITYKDNTNIKDKKLELLLKVSKECEDIFNNNFLDIEFAFSDDELYILQVRAIVQNNKSNLNGIDLDTSLQKLYRKIQKLNAPHPKILGSRSIFGVMPDWNPAEIIGIKPKRLALSLYKEIVTDEIWAYQRDNYGYRNLRSFPLLVSFLGVPYIDVRVSFNSFIPKNLHESIASKLVEYYLDELSKNSNHHDKIEFEIVFSCYYFGIDKKLQRLKSKGFSENEIKRIEFELLELTNEIIDTNNGLYKKDLQKVEQLKTKYDDIVDSELSYIDKIYWLIEDCKRYGTLPFAGIARAAFIAVQFINSFVQEGIFTANEKEQFLNSVETVSKKLSQDKNSLLKDEFISKYGHLRPGTYDICSQRYDEAYDEYFTEFSCSYEVKNAKFEFKQGQIQKIKRLIVENGLKCDFDGLVTFIKESIEGREYAKFGFSKNDLAHLDIQKIKNLYATLDHRDVGEILSFDIKKNRKFYQYTKAIKLPSLIINKDDIYSYTLEEEEANFVTLKSVTGIVVDLDSGNSDKVAGNIICIKSADPGYDYLFSKNISGLITCYGGANSHMAIRCAELGIPAVIGCGESMFEKYRKSHTLEIDAANKQIKIIS